ncbi:hypothetical protein [Hydrogenivirga sp.]
MSFKAKVLVLKRLRAGDQDLLAKVYGQGGVVDVLVRDGLLNEHRFFGLFEPFNVLEVDLSQRGGIAVPNDVGEVRFLSYLCRETDRFLWFSWIAGFILKHVRFYDERLFNLFMSYMLSRSMTDVLKVKLRLDFLELSGLKPKFIEQSSLKGRLKLSDGALSEEGELEVQENVIELLRRIYRAKRPQRIKIGVRSLHRMEELLDAFIEYHTR